MLCYNTYIRESKSPKEKERGNTMRVTKIVREFIEEKVKEKYTDRINACAAQYHEEQEEINKELRGIVAGANEQVRKFLEENYPSWAKANAERQLVSLYTPNNNEMYAEVRRREEELKRERNAHITNIVVNLELGGGRAELEEMLAKI